MSRLGNLESIKSLKFYFASFITLSLVLVLSKTVFMLGNIPSSSMENTMQIGDYFIGINTWFLNDLHRGDIVDFFPNAEEQSLAEGIWVKRVIGIPGDKIKIQEGIVFVNGVKQNETYVDKPISYNNSFTVPEGKYFVCGDNRADSWDARRWVNPFVDKSQIKFKVLFRVYPLNKFGSPYDKKSVDVQ